MKDPNQTWSEFFKEGARFYWAGTKQYGRNTAYAAKLISMRMVGHKLAWPHIRHLHIVRGDLVRLIPFSFFVLVPFAEFALPIALYVWPTMLPSTYEDEPSKQKRFDKVNAKRDRLAIEMNKMQPLLKELLADKNTKNISHDFEEPLVDRMTNAQLLKLVDFTGRWSVGVLTPRLVLRISIRRYIRDIHRDDILLIQHGVERISDKQVRDACMERCIQNNRDRLHMWVNMSGKDATLQSTTRLLIGAVLELPHTQGDY